MRDHDGHHREFSLFVFFSIQDRICATGYLGVTIFERSHTVIRAYGSTSQTKRAGCGVRRELRSEKKGSRFKFRIKGRGLLPVGCACR
jgi:hypothetical protein